MDAFSQQLQNELKDAIDKKEPGLPLYYGDVEMILNNKPEDIDEAVPWTPTENIIQVIWVLWIQHIKQLGATFLWETCRSADTFWAMKEQICRPIHHQ